MKCQSIATIYIYIYIYIYSIYVYIMILSGYMFRLAMSHLQSIELIDLTKRLL
jgi:hypothetical protein